VALVALVAAACSSSEPAPSPSGGEPPALPPAPAPTVPTYHGEIAPILSRACAACHTEGGVGPFALGSYADARGRHAALAAAVGARVMPPWLPSETCATYRDDRHLSQTEIDAIVAWSRAGAPEGDPASARRPVTPERRTLEWTDAVLDIGADYVPSQDEWRCFLIDPALAEDAILVGYDLRPTVRSQVHHAGLVDTDLAVAQAKDAADPGPGWACPGDTGVSSSRVLGSWAGGFGAVLFPAGTGVRLAKGRGIAVQIHYHLHDTSRPPPADRTQLALQLARSTPPREARLVSVGAGVAIPPRAQGHASTASMSLPEGGTVWAIQPHMHLLGRRLTVAVAPPGGAPECLLDVPRWDYRWEEMFFLAGAGRPFEAGSRVDVTCTWDNPRDAAVGYGLGIDDEMCDVSMIVTP
jgi:mono/diheme cytochrome c family protein